MTPIVPSSDKFSQDSFPDSASLDNFSQASASLGNFSQASFDIRDYQDGLEPGKGGTNFFTCPSCGGRRLSINPKSGAFKCWSGDCASADIREAIRPLADFLAEVKGERPARQAKKPKAQKKEYPPVPIPIGAKLLRLPAPGQSPQPEQLKDAPRRVPCNAAQITYEYSATQKVVRYEWPDATNPKGRDKTYSQFHIGPDGKKDWTKGDAPWPAYRIDEVVGLLKNIPDGEPIIILTLEGEPNVELGRLHGIAALTLQGSNWSDREIQKMLEALRATGKNVSIGVLRDNDDTGIKKGKGVWLVACQMRFPCIVIDPRLIHPDIPEKGDIREILEAIGPDEFLSRVNAEVASQASEPRDTTESTSVSFALDDKGKERRDSQQLGKSSELFFPAVPIPIWEPIAEKAGLPMPEFPAVGVDGVVGVEGEVSGLWEWVKTTNCPIVITKGKKEAEALISRGFAAIGLPGIYTGYRVTEKGDWVRKADGTEYQKAVARELRSELQEFDTPGREIVILFDFREGDYSESQEFKAACTTAKLFKSAIAKIAQLPIKKPKGFGKKSEFKSAIAKIAQLPDPDKGADDFAVADGDIDTVILAAPSIEEIQKQILKGLSKKNREKAWALTYPIAWECNQRYLDIPYPNSGLICIKSPKGTAKTVSLGKLVAKAQAENRKVLVVTHRIVLGRAICKVVEIPWIEEMNSDADRKIEGNFLGHGLCIDSLHPTSQALFDPKAYEGALVIFDEVEQVFWHALNSETCRKNRQAILASLKALLQTVLNSGGQVLVQDADLSNISIDFVREFSQIDVKPWVAVNNWQPSEPWDIRFYDTYHVKGEKQDDPSGLLRDAVEHINNGGKIWLSLDSQKTKSKYGSKNLEKYLRKHCPGKKILRIDSETVSNPDHPAYECSESITTELAAFYDIVIATPTLASGVSVVLRGHFTAVFGIFQGAISDNEVRQSLARVREPIPRFVWCRQIPVATIGNGSPYYREVAESKTRDVRYNLHLLKEFDFDIDTASDPVALRYWAKFAARVNTSAWDFRESVREGLLAEGHIIQSCSDDDAGTGNEIKELRVINQVEEAIAVASAPDIDKDEREKLENQRSKTDIESYSEEKYDIKEIYKVGEVTPELRQLHQDRWHSKIQLHYFLTHNPEYLWMRDHKHIDSHIRGGGKICQQDIRLLTAKIDIHKVLNTLQFTDSGKEWTNESPEILEFANKALQCKTDIKDILGIKVSEIKATENPIGIVNAFLAQFGLTLKGGKQWRKGEERKRSYSFGGFAKGNVYPSDLDYALPLSQQKMCEPEGLRSSVFEAWQQRDELALFEFQQQQQGVAAVEVDVTLQAKSAHSQDSSDLTSKSEVVTALSINKEEICSVTTTSTIETPIEPPPEPTGKKGWVNRWGKWVRASFIGLTDGCQLRILIEEVTGWNEVRAFPDQLRWDGGASC
jgi:hypothetical protein